MLNENVTNFISKELLKRKIKVASLSQDFAEKMGSFTSSQISQLRSNPQGLHCCKFQIQHRTVAKKSSAGELSICAEELDILKFDKNSTNL